MQNIDLLKSKIISGNNLKKKLAYWKFKDFKIVFTNGCFDVLHRGHIEYLAKAAQMGDILVVGLNSDESVKKIKKPPRPLQDEQSRAIMLASLCFVGSVILFDEETPEKLIKTIRPHLLVKGNDYSPNEIAGYETVIADGGEVVTVDLLPGYSTSNIVSKIKNN